MLKVDDYNSLTASKARKSISNGNELCNVSAYRSLDHFSSKKKSKGSKGSIKHPKSNIIRLYWLTLLSILYHLVKFFINLLISFLNIFGWTHVSYNTSSAVTLSLGSYWSIFDIKYYIPGCISTGKRSWKLLVVVVFFFFGDSLSWGK